jgi:UTP-glucose-1-phosphate uridylyltransferase
LYRTDGKSDVVRLLGSIEADGSTAGLLVAELPPEESISGLVEVTSDDKHFKSIIEHPNPTDIASNLLNASKYIFDRLMFDFVHQVMVNSRAANGEYQVTEALKLYVQAGKRLVVERAGGIYLDGGSLGGWLNANNVVVSSR